jgi:predicted SAM-dependent methyltransferase
VICNHVLEHVDDRKALTEIMRILAPGGMLVASVPIIEGWDTTYEDVAIKDPEDRALHFGQSDHVRWYGRDFRDRLKAAGFEISELPQRGRT